MVSMTTMASVSKNGKVVHFLHAGILIYCIVLWKMPNVFCQTYAANGMPTSMLPFCIDLPGTLRSGQVIKIIGFAEKTSISRQAAWLDIILRTRCSGVESPFYLKMRFSNRKLIRNSFQNGNWGNEENDGQFPFSLGAQFVLLIEAQPDAYKVTGNGVLLWTFPNRQASIAVSALHVTGASANIRRVELIDKTDKNQPGKSQIVYPLPLGPQPISHPTFPFWGYFPEGLRAGKAIRIVGIFPGSQQAFRTSFNLCSDCFKGPIMLHLDLRFRYNIDSNTAVRNIYVNGDWGNYLYEERDGPFPFRLREPFVILIKVQPDSYNISVDGVPCWTFKHRLPFTQVTSMTIERGPMTIWKIQYIDEDEDSLEAQASSGEASIPAAITSSSSSRIYSSTSGYSIIFISLAWVLQLM